MRAEVEGVLPCWVVEHFGGAVDQAGPVVVVNSDNRCSGARGVPAGHAPSVVTGNHRKQQASVFSWHNP